ncbi:MAG: glycosyltransferase family 1 protein [Bacteroidales bacterium]
MSKQPKIVYFFRKPFEGNHSIEELFGFIQGSMPGHLPYRNYVMRYHSKGLFRRAANTVLSAFHQGKVNHITGDVHYISLALKKKKTILTIHDLVALNRSSGLKHALIKYFWYTLPSRRVKYVTVISESTKSALLECIRIDPEKVIVIHNCLSPQISYQPKAFNTAKPTVFQIGTGHNKNLENIIRAFAGMNIRLTILGKLREHQLELLKEHQTDYANYVNIPYEEVILRYREADMVTFVSTYEGFGLPVIEANGTGRPVITGNGTSMPEVAGNAAVLVDPEDIEGIRASAIKIIEDKEFRDDLIQKGLENVKRFRPEKIAGEYADLYAKVMGESTGPQASN